MKKFELYRNFEKTPKVWGLPLTYFWIWFAISILMVLIFVSKRNWTSFILFLIICPGGYIAIKGLDTFDIFKWFNDQQHPKQIRNDL